MCCFLFIFAVGWILGPIRELWAVPHFGRMAAMLSEAFIMLGCNDRCSTIGNSTVSRLSNAPCDDYACLETSHSSILETDWWTLDYASTISGSKLVTKATTSLRSGWGTSNVSSVAERQCMKAT